MRPPGLVVSGPDTAIAMHTHIRRTGKHQKTPVRIDPFKRLPGCSCHIVAKQIVHFVMADFLPIYIVIKTFIVFFVIGHCCHLITEQPYRNLLHLVLDALAKCLLQLLHPFLGIEDCRLIHIIPEALNSLIDQIAVMASKPFSCLRIEHIRKMRVTRPYYCRKITAVLTFTEIIVFYAFLIHRVALFHLDSGINDRYKANPLLFHPLYKIRKIRKLLFIEREVLIILHIVNVHINHIQWNLIFAITLRYILKIFSCLIAPAALS